MAALDPAALSHESVPARVATHPTMMSAEEVAFLYNLARDGYSGRGLIVDAGIFLGASTLCFGHGLKANARAHATIDGAKPIWSYDLCVVNDGMLRQMARGKNAQALVGHTFQKGQSFEPYVRSAISDIADIVDLHVGDVIQARMPEQDVEIAFLDILKTPEIDRHMARTIYPRLIPGVSLVLQQDYFFERLAYIKIRQEHLGPYFDFVGNVGPTAVFRLREKIPESVLMEEPSSTLSLDAQLALIDQAAGRAGDRYRTLLTALTKVSLVKEHRGKAAAKDMLALVSREFSDVVTPELGVPRSAYLEKVLSKVARLAAA